MKSFIAPLICVALCTAGLTACSSKPGTSDVQEELSRAYDCPIFELSEIKKVDGAEVSDTLYDVAFTYTISIKGGLPAATDLLAEWYFLSQQLELADRAIIKIRQDQGDEQKVSEIQNFKLKIIARMDTVMPCKTLQADNRARALFTEFITEAEAGQGKAAIPYAEKIQSVGRMRKTEGGWRFIGMMRMTQQDMVKSEPVDYPKFKPLVFE